MAVLFFKWWYAEALASVFEYEKRLFVYLFDLFSVNICLRTLFSPWRRDFIYYDHLNIKQILEAWTLNFASRLVGFFVKISAIVVYLVVASSYTVFAIVFYFSLLVWPAIILLLLIYGIGYLI